MQLCRGLKRRRMGTGGGQTRPSKDSQLYLLKPLVDANVTNAWQAGCECRMTVMGRALGDA